MSFDIEQLRAELSYDPETGVLRWRAPGPGRPADLIAGTVEKKRGYRIVHVLGTRHRAHRIAFALMTGRWPSDQMDHRNMNRDDNRWENLREATATDNNCNKRLQRNNTSGFRGVGFDKRRQKWRAKIKCAGKAIELGMFDTPEEASAEYEKAAALLFDDFYRPNT